MSEGAIHAAVFVYVVGAFVTVMFQEMRRPTRTAIGMALLWPMALGAYLFKGALEAIGVMFFGETA